MTFLENLMKDNPSLSKGEVESMAIYHRCPFQYGYENKKRCDGNKTWDECRDCWNREMPDTEQPRPFTNDELNAINYNKGLNDAWELVNKLFDIHDSIKKEIFGTIFVTDIMKDITPQEALEKLKSYEASRKIEVGDVVILDTCPFIEYIVLTANDNEVNMYSLIPDGTYPLQKINRKNFEGIKKTGKHIDMPKLLKQIGE